MLGMVKKYFIPKLLPESEFCGMPTFRMISFFLELHVSVIYIFSTSKMYQHKTCTNESMFDAVKTQDICIPKALPESDLWGIHFVLGNT